MFHGRCIAGVIALTAMMILAGGSATAIAEPLYPDWSGQWHRPNRIGNQWDPTKPAGLGQQAPLTPEYQAIFAATRAEQIKGGQGDTSGFSCRTNGMPRVMSATRPLEIIIQPNITHIIFEAYMPRRIYTDGRAFPTHEDPTYMGYSIGKWVDKDGDGRYDVLEVETRNFKGPRDFETTGIPLHKDNQTVLKERIFLSKSDQEVLHDEITTIDNALTRPWTVLKSYRRERNSILWYEENCNESNNHVQIGDETYFKAADGHLMPTKKDQAPPDLKYFQTRR